MPPNLKTIWRKNFKRVANFIGTWYLRRSDLAPTPSSCSKMASTCESSRRTELTCLTSTLSGSWPGVFFTSCQRITCIYLRIEILWLPIFFLLFGGCSHLSPGIRCCARQSCWCSSHTWQGCPTQSTESALCLEPVFCFYRFKEEEDSCLPPSGNNDCFVVGKVKMKTDF